MLLDDSFTCPQKWRLGKGFVFIPKIGEVKLLKPDSNIESVIFKNKAENEVQNIEFTGGMDSSIKEMKIQLT